MTRAGAKPGDLFRMNDVQAFSDTAGTYLRGNRRSTAQSRSDAAARRLEGLGFAVPRNADGSVNEAGIKRRTQTPRSPTAAPSALGAGGSRGGRGSAARAAEPFRLRALQDDPLSPTAIAENARRFAQEQNEAFVAIFGNSDPLASLVDGAKQSQIQRVEQWDSANGMDKALGPLAEFRDQLAATNADISASLQNVAIGGLLSLEDGLVGIIEGTQNVGDAFKNMAGRIIADLARIAIQKAIVAALDSVLGGGGGGGGGLGNGVAGLFAIGKFFGLADGGKIEGRAGGGRIVGPGSGTSDSILALVNGKRPLRVSDGEYVMTAAATQQFEPVLEAMNRGRVPGLALGGPVLPSLRAPRVPSLSGMGGGTRGTTQHVIRVEVGEGANFHTRVTQIAGDASVQVVRMAAPGIVEVAKTATYAELRRPPL